MKTVFNSDNAPKALGTYSQAVRAGDSIYLSGQIGLDPGSLQLPQGVGAQLEQVLDNLAAVCHVCDAQLDDIVRVTVYLTDITAFDRVNEAMRARFTEPWPARVLIGVASLPGGAEVEIDAIVYKPLH